MPHLLQSCRAGWEKTRNSRPRKVAHQNSRRRAMMTAASLLGRHAPPQPSDISWPIKVPRIQKPSLQVVTFIGLMNAFHLPPRATHLPDTTRYRAAIAAANDF